MYYTLLSPQTAIYRTSDLITDEKRPQEKLAQHCPIITRSAICIPVSSVTVGSLTQTLTVAPDNRRVRPAFGHLVWTPVLNTGPTMPTKGDEWSDRWKGRSYEFVKS